MFSKQRLTGPLTIFFQVIAILIAISVFLPALSLVLLTVKITIFTYYLLYHEIFMRLDPRISEKSGLILRKINRYPSWVKKVVKLDFTGAYASSSQPQFRSIYDNLKFFRIGAEGSITLSNVMEATIALFSKTF